jgi:leucyl aminopeptidase
MDVDLASAAPADVDADILALTATAATPPRGLPEALADRIASLAAAGDFRPDPGSLLLLHLDGEIRAPRLAIVGVGPADRLDTDALRTAASSVARVAGRFGGTIAWLVDETLPLDSREQVRAIVDGTTLGGYDAGRWKEETPERPRPIERLRLVGAPPELADDAARFAAVARWTNRARDLVNAPANLLDPAALAAEAERVAAASQHVTCNVLGPAEARERGMGALLSVAAGSRKEPRLITLRYEPPDARGESTLGLVGKSITFDAGGLSIKSRAGLVEEKCDMAGGAAVLAAVGALAELGVPLRAIAVLPAAENMLGGGAYKPGDVLTAMNGTTIEINDTDAEGRLVLADALCYARELGVTHLIDLATLTGGMTKALADLYAGLFANDDLWREQVRAAASESGDHAWPLPLHPRYRRMLDSTFADLVNTDMYKEGQPASAAAFLQEFAGDGPWAHLDIAGTAYLSRPRGDYYSAPGATGYGVRLIVELALSLA